MHAACNTADIDELMQLTPTLPAQAPDPPSGGGDRQGNEKHECREAGSNEWSFRNILQHAAQVERLVQPNVSSEMKTGVKECEQAQHPAEANQPKLPRDLAQRRNRKSHHQEIQGPVACFVGDDFNRIGSEVLMEAAPDQAHERKQAGQEDWWFNPLDWQIERFHVARVFA